MGRSLARAALAVLAAALVVAPSAAAQTAQPQILESSPYYLSFHAADGEARATVLVIHGGGWAGDLGPQADQVMGEWIARLTDWRFDVANLGYRTGAPSLDDALGAFDLMRARVGSNQRLCIFGGSAGAHLALTVAARRGESVDCVVDMLGPPDLVEWGSQPWAEIGLNLATRAFGEERLAELSPINLVDRIVSPVLVAAAPCDAFIELAAQERFADALNAAGGSARLQVIAEGDEVPLGHCSVERASFEEFLKVAEPFLAGDPLPPEAAQSDDDAGVSALAIGAIAIGVLVLGFLGWRARRPARSGPGST